MPKEIKNISALTVGMYQDAMRASKPNGDKAYFSFSDWLESEALAETGSIDSSFVTGDINEQIARYGKPLSGVRQALHNSGITFLGKRSSPCAVFFNKADNKDFVKGADVLFAGLMQEVFESAIEGQPVAAASSFFTSNSSPTNLLFRDVVLDRVDDQLINDLNTPNLLRLTDIVGLNTGINSDTYRNMSIEDTDIAAYEFGRITEGAELPVYSMTTGDRVINVYKRGGAIKATYEVLRRQSVNQLAIVVTRFGLARALQLTKDALVVAVNGDGNADSAANNTAGINAPTIQTWDEYAIDIAYDYTKTPTIATADNTDVKLIRALKYPSANLPLTPDQLPMYDSFQTPGGQALRIAPKGSVLDATRKVLFWNAMDRLEQVTENGAAVSEAERFVTTQEEMFTFTYNTAFSKPMKDGFFTYTRADS